VGVVVLADLLYPPPERDKPLDLESSLTERLAAIV
jgi:hypothetical protein